MCFSSLGKEVRSMNLTTLMKIGENINEGSSIGERAAVGIQVVAIGMGVVFGVLILLIGILQIFKLFANKKSATTEIKTPAAAPAPAPVSAAPVAAVPASEEEAIVAIATSAIAAYRGESDCAFKVLSIKKIVK
ncbi:MAG: hypothetical protein E7586_00245 [Ruminococcaceae bacterium]|nr:hypothetical protein [Oscillospiraceae bacterium]